MAVTEVKYLTGREGPCAAEGEKHDFLVDAVTKFGGRAANGASDVLPKVVGAGVVEASEEQLLLKKASFASDSALQRLIFRQTPKS